MGAAANSAVRPARGIKAVFRKVVRHIAAHIPGSTVFRQELAERRAKKGLSFPVDVLDRQYTFAFWWSRTGGVFTIVVTLPLAVAALALVPTLICSLDTLVRPTLPYFWVIVIGFAGFTVVFLAAFLIAEWWERLTTGDPEPQP
jgi:hypothetical protein